MKRRPATTPIDGHAQGYFTAPLAQPLTLCLFSYPIPAFLVVCSAYTHITMVPYRAQLLGSRYGIFLQLKKFLLGFIFEWKCKTYKQKKQHTYRGALEIALDTSSTFSSIVWKLTNTKSSSQNYSGAKDWKKPSMKIKAKFEQQLNG